MVIYSNTVSSYAMNLGSEPMLLDLESLCLLSDSQMFSRAVSRCRLCVRFFKVFIGLLSVSTCFISVFFGFILVLYGFNTDLPWFQYGSRYDFVCTFQITCECRGSYD